MQTGDRPRFATALNWLAAAFRTEVNEATYDGYWFGLEDLAVESIEHACKRAVRELDMFPRPRELRELSGQVSGATQAIYAWQAVKKAIARHGVYESVNFADPVINATIRNLGGWQRICGLESEELDKWTRKDFERVYAAMGETGAGPEAGAYLVGMHELNNRAGGYKVEPPVLVQVETATQPQIESTKRPELLT